MMIKENKKYPVRVYLEDMGYNYVVGHGKLLSPVNWFASATQFDNEGHAKVRMNADDPEMIIDSEGNVIC